MANVDRVQVEIRDDKVTQFMVQTVQIKIIIDVLAAGIASSQQNSSIIPEINMCIPSPKPYRQPFAYCMCEGHQYLCKVCSLGSPVQGELFLAICDS